MEYIKHATNYAYPHCIDVLFCGQSERIHLAGCGHASCTREHWKTDQMMSAYLSLVASCFSTPDKLILTLDFMVVGSIFTSVGVTCHLEHRSTVTTKLSK